MKIQCDVCEKAPAIIICCADEAALCRRCDVEVHAANKLASKHPRLLLQCLSHSKAPPCDICREKAAFIFCVEDRALFCKSCDESIHSTTPSANHQRLLATGIRVALPSKINNAAEKAVLDSSSSSNQKVPPVIKKPAMPQQQTSIFTTPSWTDDLLQFSDFEVFNKKEQVGFGELEWFPEMDFFDEDVALEVPQLPMPETDSFICSQKPAKSYMPYKKARVEISQDDDELFTVPDLG